MLQAIKIKDIDVVYKIEVYHAHQKKRYEEKRPTRLCSNFRLEISTGPEAKLLPTLICGAWMASICKLLDNIDKSTREQNELD